VPAENLLNVNLAFFKVDGVRDVRHLEYVSQDVTTGKVRCDGFLGSCVEIFRKHHTRLHFEEKENGFVAVVGPPLADADGIVDVSKGLDN
jgi:hypothetical protein